MEEIQIRTLRDKQKEKMQKAKEFFQKREIEPIEETKEPDNKVKKIIRLFVLLFTMFVVGGIGGLYIDRILVPNILIKYPELNQYDILKQVNERTTIVRETQEIKISQEDSISESIEKVKPTVVQVFTKTNSSAESIKTGSGIILTSDGYILTALKNTEVAATETTPKTTAKIVEIKLADSEKTYAAEIKSSSTEYNLAVLKIDKNNLPVIPYAESEELKLGQKLIIIDSAVMTDIISQFVDDYVPQATTSSKKQSRIKITQNLETTFAGAAVINVEGSLVGMAEGEKIIIPFSEIEEFINSAIQK